LLEVMRAAPGAGVLEGEGVRIGRAEHPACGDEVQVFARLRGEQVVELAWRARGCPACVAVAAAAHGALVGATLAEAPKQLERRLQALGGLGPMERHAATLFLSALAQAR
jgi:NifU-like protein involved in Fe-S cluster formation